MIFSQDSQYTQYLGDAREVLKELPEHSVDCILTSPPFWGLRAYKAPPSVWDGDENCEHEWGDLIPHPMRKSGKHGPASCVAVGTKEAEHGVRIDSNQGNFCLKCGAWRGILGSEPDPDLYISHLCGIFDLCKRVLKKTGSLWVNLDDSMAANRTYQVDGTKQVPGSQPDSQQPQAKNIGIPAKSLCAIPERFILEMLKRGWIYRQTIIWQKPSCMPESVNDRCTRDFEYLYHFTQQGKYFYERQFESYTQPLDRWGGDTLVANGESMWDEGTGQSTYRDRNMRPNSLGRNRRSVWQINPEPQKPVKKGQVAHYAAFPTALCRTPILATVPEQICTKCGKPRTKVYEEKAMLIRRSNYAEESGFRIMSSGTMVARNEVKEVGLSDCGCGAPFHSGIVLDPFSGTGTVAVEARKLGRQAVLIDVSEAYCEIAQKRLEKIALPLNIGCSK